MACAIVLQEGRRRSFAFLHLPGKGPICLCLNSGYRWEPFRVAGFSRCASYYSIVPFCCCCCSFHSKFPIPQWFKNIQPILNKAKKSLTFWAGIKQLDGVPTQQKWQRDARSESRRMAVQCWDWGCYCWRGSSPPCLSMEKQKLSSKRRRPCVSGRENRALNTNRNKMEAKTSNLLFLLRNWLS